MRYSTGFALASAAFGLAGCVGPASDGGSSAAASNGPTAVAMLKDANGTDMGRVTVTPAGAGKLRLVLVGTGMPAGTRAFHVHTTGRCEGPGFTTAGGHWNPGMKQHGRDNPMGAHAGDMPNLTVAADGSASATAEIDGDMAGLLDADGAAVIVHASADDYRTDPTGNAGARIACGVFSPQ